MNIFPKKIFKVVLMILGVITILIPIIGSYFMALDIDSAVILTEMERIYEGYIPYKTMNLNYPPLWFYMMVAFKWIFQIPYGNYEFYLTIHYLFSIGCALVIYGISKYFTTKKIVSIFCAWLFLMTTHWLWGNCVLFEIPSMLFGLLACLLVLKFNNKSFLHYIYIGAIACLSFLCKQFGLGFCILSIYLIFCFSDKKILNTIFFVLGYTIPLLICLIIFGKDMYISILLNGYGTVTMELAGWDCSSLEKIKVICNNLSYFSIKVIPLVVCSIIFVPIIITKHKFKEYLFCIFGICGFSLQFYLVPQALHYYLYLVPFGILLIPILSTTIDKRFFKILLTIIVLYTTLISCYNVYRRRIYRTYYLAYEKKLDQDKIANELNKINLKNKTVWVAHTELQFCNYLSNLYPPNMEEIGYAVGPLDVTKSKAWKQIESCDYVLHLVTDDYFDYYYKGDIEQYLCQFPADTIDINGKILLRKLK